MYFSTWPSTLYYKHSGLSHLERQECHLLGHLTFLCFLSLVPVTAFYVVLFPFHVCLSFPSAYQRRPFSLLIYFCRLILFSPASPVTFLLALVFSGTVLVKNKRQRSSPISWAAICSSSGLLTTAASSRIQCRLRKLSISWHAFLSL